MRSLSSLSDSELLTRIPALVLAERAAVAEVIEHLIEIDRRRLYLEQACPSLYAFCLERLGYSEDAALKRIRVARLAAQLPRVLDELRSGALQLTALVLLAPHLNEDNAEALLAAARGKSRRKLEQLLASWFPRPDVPPSVRPVGADPGRGASGSSAGTGPSGPTPLLIRPGANASTPEGGRAKLEPLSPERYRVELTVSAEVYAKLERARELLSHSVPRGELPLLLERALDALIERELERRTGVGKPRKRRALKPGSRRVPVEVEREVRERDGDQCTFTDAQGRRCQERRFLTLEHHIPFALGGPPTVENISLLCNGHNALAARQVFGEAFIADKRRERAARIEPAQQAPVRPDLFAKVQVALCKMGFRERDVRQVLTVLRREPRELQAEPLLRAALALLTPTARTRAATRLTKPPPAPPPHRAVVPRGGYNLGSGSTLRLGGAGASSHPRSMRRDQVLWPRFGLRALRTRWSWRHINTSGSSLLWPRWSCVEARPHSFVKIWEW